MGTSHTSHKADGQKCTLESVASEFRIQFPSSPFSPAPPACPDGPTLPADPEIPFNPLAPGIPGRPGIPGKPASPRDPFSPVEKRELLVLSLADIQGNGSSERLNNLPQITQLGSCRKGIPPQVPLTPKPQLLILIYYTTSLNRDMELKQQKGKRRRAPLLRCVKLELMGGTGKKKKA